MVDRNFFMIQNLGTVNWKSLPRESGTIIIE